MAFMQMTADELERYHANHPKVMQVGMEPLQFTALTLMPVFGRFIDYNFITPYAARTMKGPTANRAISQQGHTASLTAHTSSCTCSVGMHSTDIYCTQERRLFWDTQSLTTALLLIFRMQGGWCNLARAAYAAEHALFKTSPIKYVANITAPVLFCGADYDKLCPMTTIKRAVELTPNGELYAVACDHFELFTPKVCYVWRSVCLHGTTGNGPRVN